jgi:hypothetical protein
MSRSVDLFIDTDHPADEVAVLIAGRAGLRVEAPPDGTGPRLTDGDVTAVLQEHPYLDDDDLLLTRYRYALSARATASGHLGDVAETRMLRKVASSLAGVYPVLLVLDLQYRAPLAATPGGAVEGDA